jgi:hypothetical protein
MRGDAASRELEHKGAGLGSGKRPEKRSGTGLGSHGKLQPFRVVKDRVKTSGASRFSVSFMRLSRLGEEVSLQDCAQIPGMENPLEGCGIDSVWQTRLQRSL